MSFPISGPASHASVWSDIASSGAGKSAAPRSTPPAPEPSAVVTLSKDAEVLSRFADKGLLMSMRSLNGPLGSSASAAATTYATAAEANRDVSRADFQILLERFGATEEQKASLTAGFDSNGNGGISRDEFLRGIAGTSGAKGAATLPQALLQMIDRHGDASGTVDQKELVRFTTAFADAQQANIRRY